MAKKYHKIGSMIEKETRNLENRFLIVMGKKPIT